MSTSPLSQLKADLQHLRQLIIKGKPVKSGLWIKAFIDFKKISNVYAEKMGARQDLIRALQYENCLYTFWSEDLKRQFSSSQELISASKCKSS